MKRDIGTAGGRHLALLISLLLLFILSPFVVTRRFGVVLPNLTGVAVLLSGTYAVSERKRLFAVTVILAVASVVLSGLILVLPGRWIVLTGHTCLLLLLGLFSVSILANVLRAGKSQRTKSMALFVSTCWSDTHGPSAMPLSKSCSPDPFPARPRRTRSTN